MVDLVLDVTETSWLDASTLRMFLRFPFLDVSP